MPAPQLMPIPDSARPGTAAASGSEAAVAAAQRSGPSAGGLQGPEPSLKDAFKTPDIPMLGVSLFSPHTQVGINKQDEASLPQPEELMHSCKA